MKIIKGIFLIILLVVSISDSIWAGVVIKPEDWLASSNRGLRPQPPTTRTVKEAQRILSEGHGANLPLEVSSLQRAAHNAQNASPLLQLAVGTLSSIEHILTWMPSHPVLAHSRPTTVEDLLLSEFLNRTVITVEEEIEQRDLQTPDVLKAARSAFVDVDMSEAILDVQRLNTSLPWRR